MCMCVCFSVFRELDQSEVVFETVVRAPNLLNQLPSVLTDTVSFLELSSTSLSPLLACFLSVSLPADYLCLQNPRLYFLKRSSFMPYDVGPALDSFTKSFCSSFLPLCNLCKPYHRVCHCFQIQLSRAPQKHASLHFLF